MLIESVARDAGLHFRPLQDECYDFALPKRSADRPAVRAFRRLLESESPVWPELERSGFRPHIANGSR